MKLPNMGRINIIRITVIAYNILVKLQSMSFLYSREDSLFMKIHCQLLLLPIFKQLIFNNTLSKNNQTDTNLTPTSIGMVHLNSI